MAKTEATVKGMVFLGAKKWLMEKLHPGAFERFVNEFPPSEQHIWTANTVLIVSQVPASVYINTYKAFVNLWDEELFQKVAGQIAFNDLKTILKIFMKLGSPLLTVRGFPGAYRQYFNQGEIRSLSYTSNSAEFELADAEAYGRGGCSATLGWTRKALEYSGAKGVRAEHVECRFRQGKRCLFRYSWG